MGNTKVRPQLQLSKVTKSKNWCYTPGNFIGRHKAAEGGEHPSSKNKERGRDQSQHTAEAPGAAAWNVP